MSEWISVGDKLPDDGDYVLAIHKGGVQNVMQFTERFKNRLNWVKCFVCYKDCGQYQEFYDVDDFCEITHWQPLPEPAK